MNTIYKFHVVATKNLKIIKRRICGEGKMMKLFNEIYTAYCSNDIDTINSIHHTLSTKRFEWIPHRDKAMLLVKYCDYLLAPNQKNRELLCNLLHTDQEIGRIIKQQLLEAKHI